MEELDLRELISGTAGVILGHSLWLESLVQMQKISTLLFQMRPTHYFRFDFGTTATRLIVKLILGILVENQNCGYIGTNLMYTQYEIGK